jgi:SulP family sulfate permease
MGVIQDIGKQVPLGIANKWRPASLATALLSGLLIYLLEIIFVISFAALVFSGHQASQLPQALGFILAGNALLVGVISLFSSYPGSVGVAQDTPGVVLGVVAASTAASLVGESAVHQFATTVMLIVLSTLMTGAIFLLLGVFKLGGLARFLPYPVMGGFLAGTGWLLAKGGLGIMVSEPVGPAWLSASALVHWLPGALFGIVIFVSAARIRHALTLPALLALGALVFYVVAFAAHLSVGQLISAGWLVGPIAAGGLSRFPLSVGMLAQVNWPVLLQQIPDLLPVAIISVIALLLNAGGLELLIKRDIDLNRELVVTGAGNLAAGMLGGLVGYPAISLSTLSYKMTGGKRLVGVVAALFVGLTVLFGAALVTYIPKLILGAVLVYLGVSLLVEWVFKAWFRFPKVDFAIIASVMAVIIVSGFLNGIIFGLALAIILFVVSYSRVSIVKFALTGEDYRSRVTRSPRQQQLFEVASDQLYILKLQGFVFFGTANSLFDHVRAHVQRSPVVIRFVLLDFTQVSGLDSTGLLSFTRMWQWLQEQKIALLLTGLTAPMHVQFARAGFQEESDNLRYFADLDHGVQWCEERILAVAPAAGAVESGLAQQLEAFVGGRTGVEKLVSYLRRCEYAAGDYLVRQGDQPDEIYFIESGQVSAQLESPGQSSVRLETMSGGRAVGELGFFLGIPRTAAVIVDEPSVIYSLSTEALAGIEERDPEAANLFYRIIAYLLAQRTVHLTRVVEALER